MFKPEDFTMIANVIKNTAKNLIFLYYRKSTCLKCKESNNTLFCRTRCSDKTCKGSMITDYDELSIYQELSFLNELVYSNNNSNDKDIKSFDNAMKNVEIYLKNLNSKITFTKVNISELLSFLN